MPTKTYTVLETVKGAKIQYQGEARFVVGHARTFFDRWMAVNPSWENDYTEILNTAPNDHYHCPITGANLYISRQGFMLRIKILGHGDGKDASRCALILSGWGDTRN